MMKLTRMTAVLGCIGLYWTVLGCTRRYGPIMDQSSYLSQISQIIFVEKKWSFGEVLGKFGKISRNFGKILGNFGKFWENHRILEKMCDVNRNIIH